MPGLQAQAQSWSFRHPDTTASPHNLRQTYRQTHPAAPFCSVFPRPLGPLPRCHSRWAFGLLALTYSLTASPTSPSPPAGQAFNSIPLPVLPEESGLLACRLSPRPTSSRHVLCGPPAGHCGGIQVIKIAAFQLFHGTHESRRSADEPPPPLLSPSPGASFLCHLNPPSSP